MQRSKEAVNNKCSPKAVVIVLFVSRKLHNERNRLKASKARVAALLYTRQSRTYRGGTVVSVAVACLSQFTSGARRLCTLHMHSPGAAKKFQASSACQPKAPRHVRNMGHHAFFESAGYVTALKRPSYGVLSSRRLDCGCSVVGVMSNGGVWVGPEADVCF